MAQIYSPDGGTMDSFGHQQAYWPGCRRAKNMIPQTGGKLFDSQFPTQTVETPASYPQQFFPNAHPFASAPGADSFGGHGQQASPNVRMNNAYPAISGTNDGMQIDRSHGFDFGSDSNLFMARNQQHNFPEKQADDPHEYAMTSDAERGLQMNSPFAMNTNAGPFATRVPKTSPYGGYHQYAMGSSGGRSAQMGNTFAMLPGVNQFAQSGIHSPDADMSGQHESESSHVAQQAVPYVQMTDQDTNDSVSNSFTNYNNPYSDGYTNNQSSDSSEVVIKREHMSDDDYVPGDVAIDEDVDEETSEQPGKKRKINKNGRARKVREPRGHLRRWDDSDVSRALMGIVWACGENGVVIPFAQAAKIVDQDCTSGALQQAILKMHDKMNKDGAQLPKIKMNWPKKPSAGAKSIIRDNGKVPRKKPTLTQATQCNIVSLPARPRKTTLAASEVVPQDLPMDESGFGQSAPADVKHERADEMMSSPQHVSDLPPSTPVQARRSPVCPPAPRHPMAPRTVLVDGSTGGTTLNQRLHSGEAPSSLPNSDQQRPIGSNLLGSSTDLRNTRPQKGRSSTAKSRNATSSTDFAMDHSPMTGHFQANDDSQNFREVSGMQSSFSVGEFFQPSSSSSSIDDLSHGFHPTFAPNRRDSVYGSGAHSIDSSQGSTGVMKRSAKEAQRAFQDLLQAAAAERPMTPMHSRAMRAYRSLQQPHQQLSLGLDTLDNPFGGTFDDASREPFSPTHPSSGDMNNPFGLSSTTDSSMGFDAM